MAIVVALGLFTVPSSSGAFDTVEGAQQACFKRNGVACFNLGAWQVDGAPGLEKDVYKAHVWFRLGCEYGSRDSCFNTAVMLHGGFGNVQPNEQKARLYFQKACDLGQREGCDRAKPPAVQPSSAAPAGTMVSEARPPRPPAAASPPPRSLAPAAPGQAATVPNFEAFLVPFFMADARTYVPGTLKVTEARPFGLQPNRQRIRVSYEFIQKWDGRRGTAGRELEVRDGRIVCVLKVEFGSYVCAPNFENFEQARLMGEQDMRSHLPRDEGDRAWAAASARRERGSPLNPADAACLKTFWETYYVTERGRCLEGNHTRRGEFECDKWEYDRIEKERSYEKNLCTRPLKLRVICGGTEFGAHTVQPGAIFQPNAGPMCIRVY